MRASSRGFFLPSNHFETSSAAFFADAANFRAFAATFSTPKLRAMMFSLASRHSFMTSFVDLSASRSYSSPLMSPKFLIPRANVFNGCKTALDAHLAVSRAFSKVSRRPASADGAADAARTPRDADRTAKRTHLRNKYSS